MKVVAPSDLHGFLVACGQDDWVGAAGHYRGSFLEGLYVEAAVQFHHWVDGKRVDLAKQAQSVVEHLVAAGQLNEAIAITEALLVDDPGNDFLIRSLTRCRYEVGGRPSAQAFADSLSPERRATAVDTIADLEAAPEHMAGTAIRFVGRKKAMLWLEARYEAALQGSTQAALIEGEAGVGKTALLDRFARLLAIRGARVLLATAYRAEQNVPLGVVGQWLDSVSHIDLGHSEEQPWFSVLQEVFPDLNSGTIVNRRFDVGSIGYHRLLESLRRLLVELSSIRPVVMVVDDLQWADHASLSFIHYALRRGASSQVLFVATIRSDKKPPGIDVTQWVNSQQLALSGLSKEETAQIVAELAAEDHRLSDVDQAYLFRQTGGNPLLLSILLDEWVEGRGHSAEPPQTVVEFFRPRLEQRSWQARSVLGALSILGEPSDNGLVTAVSGLTPSEGTGAIAELGSAMLIDEVGELIALRHGLVGEVALSLFSAPEKQQMHGRAARQLERRGASSSVQVAVSYDLAGDRADAFEASLRASQACDVLHARSEKEFFLKLALSNAVSPSSEAIVRIELGELYIKQGQPNEALEVLETGLSDEIGEVLRRQTEVTRLRAVAEMTGDIDVLHDLWRQAQIVGEGLPTLAVAKTYTDIAGVAHDLGLDSVAAEIAARIEADLSGLPANVDTSHHLLRPIAIIGLHNGYRVALERLDSLRNPERTDPVYAASYHATKATILVAAGALPDAEELFALSLAITERYALFDHSYTIHNNLGVCLMEQGRHREADHHFHVAADFASADVSPSHHSTARDNLTTLAYEQARYDKALEMGTSLIAARKIHGARTVMSLYAIIGLSGLEIGDLQRCREAERELLLLLQRHGEYSNDMSYVHTFLARMMNLRGETEDALKRVSRASEYYEGRNQLAKSRLDLERCRLLGRAGSDCRKELQKILAELRGTGAVPLIERAEALKTRLDGLSA